MGQDQPDPADHEDTEVERVRNTSPWTSEEQQH